MSYNSGIRVLFACRLCAHSFDQVSHFIAHKKEYHFQEFQRTTCIVFEDKPILNSSASDGYVDVECGLPLSSVVLKLDTFDDASSNLELEQEPEPQSQEFIATQPHFEVIPTKIETAEDETTFEHEIHPQEYKIENPVVLLKRISSKQIQNLTDDANHSFKESDVGRAKYAVKKTWTEEAMKNAIKEHKEKGTPFATLSAQFNIPATTLKYHFKRKGQVKKHGLIENVFSTEEEHQIISELNEITDIFHTASRDALSEKAFEIAHKKRLRNRFNRNNRKAGYDWTVAFLNRHKNEIDLKTATPLSTVTTHEFTKENVNNFFDKLENVLRANPHLTANRIFAVDKTSLAIVTRRIPICGQPDKLLHKLVPKDRRSLISVLYAVNATGDTFIPPFFMFPKAINFSARLKHGPVDCQGFSTPTGHITLLSFLEWLQHFRRTTDPTENNHVILIVSYEKAIISYFVLNYCAKYHIHLLVLPPETSDHLQPVKKTLIPSLEKLYDKAMKSWMNQNPHLKPKQSDIPAVLKPIYAETATVEIAVNGFIKTGIFLPSLSRPSRNVHIGEDFVPSPGNQDELELDDDEDAVG